MKTSTLHAISKIYSAMPQKFFKSLEVFIKYEYFIFVWNLKKIFRSLLKGKRENSLFFHYFYVNI